MTLIKVIDGLASCHDTVVLHSGQDAYIGSLTSKELRMNKVYRTATDIWNVALDHAVSDCLVILLRRG